MKVILIKNYEKHKVNEIIEVNDGFGKNFLIKNGYAQPVNEKTLANLQRVKANIAENLAKEIAEASAVKAEIEKLNLTFYLKSNGNIVHGNVTSKAIEKELAKHNIKVGAHALKGVSYNTFGVHMVSVKLHDQVTAKLKITILEEK
ncbi:50S ribosomal protein L9 [Metamycoplasma neophronis]|uniref:Large ribosomal subunit protein bL9 n=1 Tax=Metamycoplasma neophronis TaxID=872983 RepID=A0ABY2Z2B1_9BACT|nr:50S ribosomal protein L9 [Metamycoplasma neophronis]TPR54271.1 50S ribosomal protein L9 [Metamycoplasma neophronis]